MKSRVVLIACDSYEKGQVYKKLKTGLKLLGPLDSYIDKEEKVLLKLNLVRGAAAERAVTTHPAVAEALAGILREEGYGHLAAGDSSGFGSPLKIMKDLGLEEAFRKYGVEMKEFREAVRTEFPEGIHARQFMLAKDVLEADALISVCKMKTHALEHITGAVKNQYGCVQGFHKAKGHTLYADPVSFARMLADLNRLVKPRLYVMDGAHGSTALVRGSCGPGQCVLPSGAPGPGTGSHQRPGRADGAWHLEGRTDRTGDGRGSYGTFPGCGKIRKSQIPGKAKQGKDQRLDGSCGDF